MKLKDLLSKDNIEFTINALEKRLNIDWNIVSREDFKNKLSDACDSLGESEFDVILDLAKTILIQKECSDYMTTAKKYSAEAGLVELGESANDLQIYSQNPDGSGIIAIVKGGNKLNAFIFDPKSNKFKTASIAGYYPFPSLISHEEAIDILGQNNYEKLIYLATVQLKEDCSYVASDEPNSTVGARNFEEMPLSATVINDLENGITTYRMMVIYPNSMIKFYPDPSLPGVITSEELIEVCSDLAGYDEIISQEIFRVFY